jgi:hypothetical protein
MTARTRKAGLAPLASVLALGLAVQVTPANAQPDYGPQPQQGYEPPQGYAQPPPGYGQPPPGYAQPPPAYGGQSGYSGAPPGYGYNAMPPPGQYAPPPDGAELSTYDPREQQYDRDYAASYQRWAGRYCVDQRSQNTAAGAIIGGVLGAMLGAGVAGHHDQAAGALAGGALGAVGGAAIGSSAGAGGACPPGYFVAPGAPTFFYSGPVYGPLVATPTWYHPWVFAGGRWVYRPYRYWYWANRRYDYGGPPGPYYNYRR